VALVMSAGIPFVEAFWAVQLIGAVSVAFNPAVPEETRERRARAAFGRGAVLHRRLARSRTVRGGPRRRRSRS